MPSKRQEQKELTRKRILETAFRLYADSGFATPTNIIARQANVSHGAVFVHFPTREILQLKVLERFAEEVGEELHNLSITGCGIADLLSAHIDVLTKYEAFYSKLISELSSLPDETRLLLVTLQSAMSHHFGEAIEQMHKAGTVKDIPLHMLFNTWLGLLHYYLQNRDLFAPGASVLKSRRDELINSYVKLITN